MIDHLDHVAVLVADLEAAVPYYRERLGLAVVTAEDLPEAGVRVAYLDLGGTLLQLVQPTRPGPIDDHLREYGEGLHHLCFAVRDLDDAAPRLADGDPGPVAKGGRDRRSCFLPQRPNGLHIELTELAPAPAR